MYESCFDLDKRPFMPVPQPACYFPARTIEAARQALSRCIERGAGPGLLIGPAGTGKTHLCYTLAEQFRPSYAVALLTSAHVDTRKALLQAILFELDLPYRNMEEGEMRLFLIDHVSPGRDRAAGLVLLVDEAQLLSLKLLEEIRMLSNLVREGQPRVHVVLAGNPLLEERFTLPKLTAFNQRLATRCYLSALSREETGRYVRSQVKWSGGDADELFDQDAYGAIYIATDGVPRLINQVCDHALILAAAGGTREIGEAGIEEAWADLQQLPTPFVDSRSPNRATGSDIVEFGTLMDEHAGGPVPEGDDIATHEGPVATRLEPSMDGAEDTSTVLPESSYDQPTDIAQRSEDAADETGEMFVLTNPERQLDEIEDKVFRVADEHDDVFVGESAVRVDPGGSSDESVLTGQHDASNDVWPADPFSEPFEETEAIVDHLASLSSARPVTNTYLPNDDEAYSFPVLPLPIAHALASDSPVITEDLLPKEAVLVGEEGGSEDTSFVDSFADGHHEDGAAGAKDASFMEAPDIVTFPSNTDDFETIGDGQPFEETAVAASRVAEYQAHEATATRTGDRQMDEQDATNPNPYDASISEDDDRSSNPHASRAAHRESGKEYRQLFARLRRQ